MMNLVTILINKKMGKTNYLQRVNTLLKDNVSKLITASKLRTVLNTGYDDILEDITMLSKIKVFETLQDIESYASTSSGVYKGEILVLKGNPSVAYVVNGNRSVSPLAPDTTEKEDKSNKINTRSETPSPFYYPSERLFVNELNKKADLENGVVISSQLPSYIDSIIEAANFAALPAIGAPNKIYITIDDSLTYRWGGTVYAEVSKSIGIGETANTAYRGDRGKIAYDHSQLTHAPANAQPNSDITPEEVAAKLPSNVLLNDGTTQMIDSQVQEILSRPFSFMAVNNGGDGMTYNSSSISLYSGDFRSIFNNGSFIKLYGGLSEYYVTVRWATYYSEMNMTNIAIESEYTPLPHFLYLVKISNIPVVYIPKNPKDIATKEYVDSKPVTLIGESYNEAYRGDRGKTAYEHSQITHAPANAQKNSDITPEEVAAKLPSSIETTTSLGDIINGASAKGTLISNDMFVIRDSVTGFLQKVPWSSLKDNMRIYLEQFFPSAFKTINEQSILGTGNITISGGSGTTTPETVISMGDLINSSSSKGTPVDGDHIPIRDSVTGLLQKVPFLALKGTLKTYFDQFYAYVFKTINGQSIIGNGDITISGGGTSTPETATSMGALINSSTDKSAPVDADMFAIRDSVTGFLQKISFSNLKKVFKDYFDTLYNNYTHPANHPASIITQDTNNRFASDTEKATWNGKSNFSGAYADLLGKPSIPTSLSQLSEDSTHKHITEAEKTNIPKNAALVQDFSQAGITIDFAAYDIQEDDGFDANEALTTGNKDITISNPFLNKVVTILLPKISEGTVIRLPAECKKLTGDYNDKLQNIVMIHCTRTSPARYLYTISQIQA